ncbi:unnamed protein product [Chilo suppressalis]|uniref:Nudix hydrolase domain-containing protein n=1 Tax=Chilo suppressalis TaxID=168631 RepID=A0ABN8L7R5_CHISP|nr:unnamed protein product [Chilo suppressalis]
MATFTIQHIFSLACRDRCIAKMRTLIPLPTQGPPPKDTAAVLVPLCRVNGIPSLLYAMRSNHLGMNTGLVSFPGGKSDPKETAVQAALRETYEQLGIAPDKINVWGQGPAIPSRNSEYMITPVIGVIPELKSSDMNINILKVAEAFTVPVEILCNPKNQYYTQYSNGLILPVFIADEYKIWGITAYITHTFLTCALSKEVYQNEWLKQKIDLNTSSS